MKIDAEGRAFFSRMETLKRMDELWNWIDVYVDDLAARVFGAIATELGALTKKKNSLANSWAVV